MQTCTCVRWSHLLDLDSPWATGLEPYVPPCLVFSQEQRPKRLLALASTRCIFAGMFLQHVAKRISCCHARCRFCCMTDSRCPLLRALCPISFAHAFDLRSIAAQIHAWLPRMSCMVVGPGLGRDPVLLEIGKRVIESCREHNVPLIIDADGLWIINSRPDIIKGCKQVTIKPGEAPSSFVHGRVHCPKL